MLHRAARNAYSWWWASHIRTKQSKWLDQNLQDMEEKVEYILKIIEEDGDSFAKRAEMYYRKRPELLNFVEDSFRGYRALAERYDHLSRELQNANRTIATVYPEQVQLAMDEEDEEMFPTTTTTTTTSSPFSDSKKPTRNLPEVPKLNIPKTTKTPQRNSKAPIRMMSKKGLLKMSVPAATTAAAAAATTSGMSKAEALEEIDKLQKNILGLQTEKEFVKSSYEKGVSKYWEIEEQVTEMQAKINLLQDEFGIGTFIEDDEARTLMAATALKSCQETLIRLQEKQKTSDEEARIEHQRIKESHEKLKLLKENFCSQTSSKDLLENLDLVGTSVEVNELDLRVDSAEKESRESELLREKIREQLQVDSNTSLNMSELAEKIDDLVEKVITLETAVSSQNAFVTRLRLESDKLQGHLRSLEEDKEALIEGSDSKSNKIRELEQELLRIQSFNQNVENQNRNLRNDFTQASISVDHLSEKLQTVKQEDEEVEHVVAFKDLGAIAQEKGLQVDEEPASPNDNPRISKEKIDVMEPRASTSSDVDKLLVPVEVRDVPNASPERKSKENEAVMALGYDSVSSENVRMKEEAKKYDASIKAEERFIQRELSFRLDDLYTGGEIISVGGGDRVEELNEHEETMAPGRYEVIRKDVNMEEREKKNDTADHHTVRAEEQISFQFNIRDSVQLEDLSGQVRTDLGTHSESFRDHVISTDVQTEKGEKKIDSQDLGASARTEEGNIVCSNPSNPFDDFPRKGQATAAQDFVPERVFKEHEGVVGAGNDSMISNDTTMERKRNGKVLDYSHVRGEENCVHSNPKDANEQMEEKKDFVNGEENNIQSNPRNHINYEEPKSQENHKVGPQEMEAENGDQPNWQELYLSGLDNKEKILLQQYNLVLRNYEEAKKQLGEMEKNNRDSLFESAVQIKELKNANTLKDAEIRALHKKLNLWLNETPDTGLNDSNHSSKVGPEDSTTREATSPVFDTPSPNPDLNQVSDSLDEQKDELNASPRKSKGGEKRVVTFVEPHLASMVEEKFRSDIDGLLEENIEFWLRFSTSFHQIQKLQTSFHDLQEELSELREARKQEGSGSKHHSMNSSDVRPIYQHLREIQTELALWLEHNSFLEDDLQNRLSSLSSIHEEISRVSNARSKGEEQEQEPKLPEYQAAKFQGEVLNMKQENNKVGYKLQAGLDRVKELQVEIEKTIENLEEELGMVKNQQRKSSSSRSRIPLRSFLFGVRLRKQRPSLFHCMSPALQKQYSDLSSLPP